ncbi:RidA family protein [Sediminispirochaeta bajacaliforniensis]|uniref:RidA family protein n=1 Tax=Sediminispirochaeta bajacaliforniensis TaxID=148 RepID=UPI000382D068|nr:RidA family protein [Sediminispirochaeta bajacaliforniensis]
MIKPIVTEKAPPAIGPYSQAVETDTLIFVSGQLPINPATGCFASAEIKGQTQQSVENVRQVLQARGLDLDRVVKTTVFLSDMENFTSMNEVYRKMFAQEPVPARSAVEVSRLPKDALVEIEAIATKN